VLDALAAEIVPALEAAGAEPLLIKGPALAQWLYDDPAERHYTDVDLLVPREALPAARQVLRRHGFEPIVSGLHDHEHSVHHETWVREHSLQTPVELHHTLALVEAGDALVWQRLSEGRRRVVVAGTPVQAPGFAACALIVALHAAHHGARAPRPMADLARAVARVDLETWRAAAHLASELRALAAFAVGLRLDPGGRALAGELGLPEDSTRELRLHARTPPRTAFGIEQLVAAPGARARFVLLRQKIAPSPEFMRSSPTVDALAESFAAAYGKDAADVRGDVDRILECFRELGLVELA
jgi:hypothetical protein